MTALKGLIDMCFKCRNGVLPMYGSRDKKTA